MSENNIPITNASPVEHFQVSPRDNNTIEIATINGRSVKTFDKIKADIAKIDTAARALLNKLGETIQNFFQKGIESFKSSLENKSEIYTEALQSLTISTEQIGRHQFHLEKLEKGEQPYLGHDLTTIPEDLNWTKKKIGELDTTLKEKLEYLKGTKDLSSKKKITILEQKIAENEKLVEQYKSESKKLTATRFSDEKKLEQLKKDNPGGATLFEKELNEKKAEANKLFKIENALINLNKKLDKCLESIQDDMGIDQFRKALRK